MKKIYIANDHAGYELKIELCKHLEELGYDVVDLGTNGKDSVDYPDFAYKLAQSIKNDDFGILICGSGIGISIAANRHKNIRAALCDSEIYAKLSREHNDANVLCLGGRLLGIDRAKSIVDTFLNTDFSNGIRHKNRIEKLTKG